MKIIEPYVNIITSEAHLAEIPKIIERAGRVCYKSEEKMTDDSYILFIQRIIASGHESVLEHGSITVQIVCDRGVSHEIVRHRLASYSQESTRYCNYSKGKFGGEITVIKPCGLPEDTLGYDFWKVSCETAERFYKQSVETGVKPQDARDLLPNSLKTELYMTANIREWRHFLKLRRSPAAHPQMRQVADMIYDAFCDSPVGFMFEDLES